MSGERSERVFISYSHDSPAHEQRVLKLANRLRREGVDAWLDRYEPHPAEGWPRWMQQQLEGAAFVLAVCTEIYCRRFEGNEQAGKGLGATWEGMLATLMLYEGGGRNDRLIPVLFKGGDEVVPRPLRQYARYRLPNEYKNLYRRLTNQEEGAPPLGERIKPAMGVSSVGAPEPTQLASPFIVGPP